ncbi:beta-ketoacyl-[acyl-carrier-protein] synthase family protein [Krasilnikovia sp. M28-CT-15]|uniref:beta-ketoacyl-[acyl-carrier-protein] synthase family protein n=1 Tax=Krasilnikovia sp. M28-CT-15 TaxID=3373540 RepID=UPI0038776BCD
MTTDVAISGFGVWSAFGRGPGPLLDHVFQGKANFRTVDRFDVTRFRSHHAAQATDAPTMAQAFADAAQDAVAMAELSLPGRAGVLLGTQGDWSGLTSYWRTGELRGLPAATAGHHPAGLAAALALGPGRRRAFVNGCIAATTAIIQAAQLIAYGREQVVFAGGGYLVDEEFFAKFDSGHALTTASVVRPFSRDRSGLLLGDGLAVLILEPLHQVLDRGARPLAVISGWGLASDAYHVCRPHPDGRGMALAISRALERAGAAAADIDYVNAHGTGTPANDPAESRAIRHVFGAQPPPVSSTKSTTGHALEGSGALEAVISVLALTHGLLPPTAGFTEVDPDCAVDCVPNAPRQIAVRQVVSLSAAFGGANAALVLRRPS